MKQHHKMALGYLSTVLGGICWGIGGVCGQTLFEQNAITSDWLVPIRLLSAGLLLLAASGILGKHPLALWKERKNDLALLCFGLIGSAVCQYGYYTAIQYSNAAFATVLAYTAPVIILLYTVGKERRRPKWYELCSVLFVALGAFSCATQFQLGALNVSPEALFWGMLSSVAFAFYTLTPQKLIQTYSLLPVIGSGMVIGGVAMWFVCRPWTISVTVNGHLFLMMIGVVLIGTVCSFCFYQEGVRIVGGLAGSVLSAAEPLTSVILSAWLLHAAFTGFDLAGFGMILIAIPMISVGQHWTAKRMARS